MTALRGSVLVRKDHPVIRFRGEIDALEAAVIESAFVFQRLGLPALAQEMEEILQFLRQVLRCEVLSLPLPEIQLLGMTEEDIHVRSHEPQRFYGLGHFSPAPEHGEAVARLNLLPHAYTAGRACRLRRLQGRARSSSAAGGASARAQPALFPFLRYDVSGFDQGVPT